MLIISIIFLGFITKGVHGFLFHRTTTSPQASGLTNTTTNPTTTESNPSRQHLPTGFLSWYVGQDGSVTTAARGRKDRMVVTGSPMTSAYALKAAVNVVYHMTRHMSRVTFNRLVTNCSVGVFTSDETLAIFPEYSSLRNDSCAASCSDDCARTCTGEGRKYANLPGYSGYRAVVLDANVACLPDDPYRHRENILAHEFAHTIHTYALDEETKRNINQAFNNAKSNGIWSTDSYAMRNVKEYFAEASTVFLGVNRYSLKNTGNMNLCGSNFCESERKARDNLKRKDKLLYDVLVKVFTNSRPNLMSDLKICPPDVDEISFV